VVLEFQIELEYRNVDFCGWRKTGEPGEKPSEASALTTVPSLLQTIFGSSHNLCMMSPKGVFIAGYR